MIQLQGTAIADYALAGNATVTLQSGKTDTYFTYKITVSPNDDNLYFCKTVGGQNNESDYVHRLLFR